MKIFLAGNWVDKPKKLEVKNPFDNSVIDTVPKADATDLEKALAFAERGAKVMAKLSSYERWKILRKAADLMAARNEELGQTISKEEGKVITEGRGEASRAVETIMGSAEEAKRIYGTWQHTAQVESPTRQPSEAEFKRTVTMMGLAIEEVPKE